MQIYQPKLLVLLRLRKARERRLAHTAGQESDFSEKKLSSVSFDEIFMVERMELKSKSKGSMSSATGDSVDYKHFFWVGVGPDRAGLGKRLGASRLRLHVLLLLYLDPFFEGSRSHKPGGETKKCKRLED